MWKILLQPTICKKNKIATRTKICNTNVVAMSSYAHGDRHDRLNPRREGSSRRSRNSSLQRWKASQDKRRRRSRDDYDDDFDLEAQHRPDDNIHSDDSGFWCSVILSIILALLIVGGLFVCCFWGRISGPAYIKSRAVPVTTPRGADPAPPACGWSTPVIATVILVPIAALVAAIVYHPETKEDDPELDLETQSVLEDEPEINDEEIELVREKRSQPMTYAALFAVLGVSCYGLTKLFRKLMQMVGCIGTKSKKGKKDTKSGSSGSYCSPLNTFVKAIWGTFKWSPG